MLINIKSSYITKIILSHLKTNVQLKLIKHNKSLQNKINIDIINYKFYSGRYIVNGKNKTYEYDSYNGDLIYEGDYKNGERNGKGEEYYIIRNLKFKGEYLNGKRNGKGEEYYTNGQLKFKGEYLNGNKINGKIYYYDRYKFNKKYDYDFKRNGFNTEYDVFGNLIFEGEYINGERNGKGKEYGYDVEYLNGVEWNVKRYDKNNKILCDIKNGKGYIKEYDNFGDLKFECEYSYGEKTGKGKEYDYYGELRFEGEYLYGHKLKGKEFINRNLEFEGEYLYDKKWNGKGYDINHNVIYELKYGNGKVKEYDNFGKLIFEGECLNGKRLNGKGKNIQKMI